MAGLQRVAAPSVSAGGLGRALALYLRAEAALPFSRPDHDCCFMAAEWVRRATGTDPAADLRGAYSNARGAARLLRAWGGMECMWRVHMAVAGFCVTRAPRTGDVGVVLDLTGTQVAAIRAGRAWAAKAARGVLLEDFTAVVCWSIERG